MDTLAKPVRMNPDMTRLLDKLRSDNQPYPVYHQPAEEADEKVCAIGQSLVTDANLQFAVRNQYMWFVRELARLLRTRYGRDLAFHLELVLRKWQGLGLSPNIMQIIVCEVHYALKPDQPLVPVPGNGSQTTAKVAKACPERSRGSAKRGKPEARSPNDDSNPKPEGQTAKRAEPPEPQNPRTLEPTPQEQS